MSQIPEPVSSAKEAIQLLSALEKHLHEFGDRSLISVSALEIGINKSIALVQNENASIAIINPVVEKVSDETREVEERCYSLTGKKILTRRPEDIWFTTDAVWGEEMGQVPPIQVSYSTLPNPVLVKNKMCLSLSQADHLWGGKVAVAVQHEIDHLLGVNITEKTDTKVLPLLLENARISSMKVGRNEPCPCGSGKKFKKCCGKGE